MFALTSGTTAARKYIPVTPQYLADYRRGWHIWGLKTYRDHLEVKLRPIVQMSGDWDEFRTEAGIPCGAVTGLTAAMQKRIIRLIYCVPPGAGKIKDAIAKYYLVLRLSVHRPVGMVIAANPSTLIGMARTGNDEKASLIRDLYNGTLDTRFEIPADLRAQLDWRIRRRRIKQARKLEAIVERTGTLLPRDYWSENCLLGNWTGGSMGAYLRHYPRYFGATPVRDIGLVASEGRMTIPMADGTPGGVLDITSHYFEFIPEDEIDRPQPTTLSAHEVMEGRKYYIIPTTAFGLYRYHISDLVRVLGFHKCTPVVEFLSKGAHVANITGEKLSEYHVTRAMQQVLYEQNLSVNCYALAPCWNEDMPYYGLFVERGDFTDPHEASALAEALDDRLHQLNDEYASKRGSRRLGKIRVELLAPGAWAAWDQKRLLQTGGTFEQYKRPCLIPDLSFRDSMPVEKELVVPENGAAERRVG